MCFPQGQVHLLCGPLSGVFLTQPAARSFRSKVRRFIDAVTN